MGKLSFTGSEALNEALHRISDIPWEVTDQALTGMADVAMQEIRESGLRYGVWDDDSTVHVLDKIKANKSRKKDDGGAKSITFSGTRTRNGIKTRNAEIAFIQEYGKRGVPARPFIQEAMTRNTDRISAPGEKILGDWIEKEFASK